MEIKLTLKLRIKIGKFRMRALLEHLVKNDAKEGVRANFNPLPVPDRSGSGRRMELSRILDTINRTVEVNLT